MPIIQPDSHTPQVLKLHHQGLTAREIAKVEGITTQVIYHTLRLHGLVANKKENV